MYQQLTTYQTNIDPAKLGLEDYIPLEGSDSQGLSYLGDGSRIVRLHCLGLLHYIYIYTYVHNTYLISYIYMICVCTS